MSAKKHREHRAGDAADAGGLGPRTWGDHGRGGELRQSRANEEPGHREQIDAGRVGQHRLCGNRDADPLSGDGADVIARLQKLLVLATPRVAGAGGRSAVAG